jgi:hypothetical protein
VIFSNFPEGIGHVKSSKLCALVIASAAHHPMLPDVPTTAEAGAPQLAGESSTSVMAPASTPEAMVAKLSAELLKIMAMLDMDEHARRPSASSWVTRSIAARASSQRPRSRQSRAQLPGLRRQGSKSAALTASPADAHQRDGSFFSSSMCARVTSM